MQTAVLYATPAPAVRCAAPAAGAVRPAPRPLAAGRPTPSALVSARTAGVNTVRNTQVVCAVAEPPAASGNAHFDVAPGPNSTLVVTVTVEPALIASAYKKVLDNISKSAQSPGFRNKKKGGKQPSVPEALLIAEAGGKDKVNAACVEELMMRTMADALESVADRAYVDSERIVNDQRELLANFALDKDFTYQIAVDTPPEVVFKSDYKDITICLSKPMSEEEVEAQVEAELRAMRKNVGSLEVAEDKTIQAQDTLIVNLQVTRLDENVPITGMCRDNFKVDLDDRDSFPPEFIEGLLSMELKESRAIELTFPADWQPETLAGVPVRFDVTLNEIFRWSLPELNDEFVKAVDPELGSVDQLKEALRTASKVEQELSKEMELSNAVMDALADIVEMDIPEFMVQQIGAQQYQAKLMDAQQKGLIDYNVMQTLLTDAVIDQHIKDNREEMVRIAKSTMAVEHIYHVEKIEVSEEKIQAEMQAGIKEFKAQGQDFDEERLREQVEEMQKGSAVMEFLMDAAKVEYAES